jgi:hypothetical protein
MHNMKAQVLWHLILGDTIVDCPTTKMLVSVFSAADERLCTLCNTSKTQPLLVKLGEDALYVTL